MQQRNNNEDLYPINQEQAYVRPPTRSTGRSDLTHHVLAHPGWVRHATRAATDATSLCTILSIDGRSLRPRLQKLKDVQSLRGSMAAVVCAFREISAPASVTVQLGGFSGPSQRHRATPRWRAGGGPLLPLLFSLAIHDALVEVKAIFSVGNCPP